MQMFAIWPRVVFYPLKVETNILNHIESNTL